MKHHCHCGLDQHFKRLHVKKFGVLGATLMVLHVLFHVIECLVLPSLFVAFSGHLHEDDTFAASKSSFTVEAESETTACPQLFTIIDANLLNPTFASVRATSPYLPWTLDTTRVLSGLSYCE